MWIAVQNIGLGVKILFANVASAALGFITGIVDAAASVPGADKLFPWINDASDNLKRLQDEQKQAAEDSKARQGELNAESRALTEQTKKEFAQVGQTVGSGINQAKNNVRDTAASVGQVAARPNVEIKNDITVNGIELDEALRKLEDSDARRARQLAYRIQILIAWPLCQLPYSTSIRIFQLT